jgi:4,5-DOPA dioxygenase extradiol
MTRARVDAERTLGANEWACDPRARFSRRDVLRILGLASAAAASTGGCIDPAPRHRTATPRATLGAETAAVMPVIFAAHGNPMFMDDALFMRELHDWAIAMPRPRAILMVSAHWEARPVTLGATRTVPLVYDFYGFPERYYRVRYPAPGAPELASRVRGLLSSAGIAHTDDADRGLDHGAYVPMICMYPDADVPVLQVSLPSMDPREVFAVGRALAPLRRENVLLIGSGFLTHNLRTGMMPNGSRPPSWASEFDHWARETLVRRDFDALLDYRARAPGVAMALPTHEHFVPVLVTAGASMDRAESARFPIEGFVYGSFTKRSVQYGA